MVKQFDGITKYLSDLPAKTWDVNRLCGDFFGAFSKNNTALCSRPFDVLMVGSQRIVKTVTVQCGGKTDLYVLVSPPPPCFWCLLPKRVVDVPSKRQQLTRSQPVAIRRRWKCAPPREYTLKPHARICLRCGKCRAMATRRKAAALLTCCPCLHQIMSGVANPSLLLRSEVLT